MSKARKKKTQTKAQASAPAGRDMGAARRIVGVNVVIAVLVAAGLLVFLNIISNLHSGRVDARTLGHHRLSDSAKAILAEVSEPVRLTSIYTSDDKDRDPDRFLPPVENVLAEVREAAEDITVVNVTGDRQKAKVVGRLKQRLQAKAADHIKVIDGFQTLIGQQRQQYESMATSWAKYPPTGWLGQFGTAKAVEKAVAVTRDEMSAAAEDLRGQGSALPDYDGMRQTIVSVLEAADERLGQIAAGLTQLSALPEMAAEAREKLTAAAGEVDKALAQTVKNLGKPDAPEPADPAKVLDQFVADVTLAAEKSRAAGRQLQNLNEAGNGYVRYAKSWQVVEGSLPGCYGGVAGAATSLARQAQGVKANLKTDAQKKFVADLRSDMAGLAELSGRCTAGVGRLLEELTKLDKPTQEIFRKAKETDYLKGLQQPISDLLGRAKALGTLEDQKELIEKINEDNIIIVEVGEKTGVVTFDEVWPVARQSEMGPASSEEKRAFYGDMAVCSKILSMTTEPLAQVALTFFEDMPPPFMRQYGRRGVSGPIPSMYLQTLRERLEKANLKVTDWNLAQEDEPPVLLRCSYSHCPERGKLFGLPASEAEAAELSDSAPGSCPKCEEEREKHHEEDLKTARIENLPRVLMVLPPPEPTPPMARMGPQQPKSWSEANVEMIRQAVEDSAGAIFLASYLPAGYMGMPTPYGLADYLKKDWGVEVKSDLRVVQGVPDPDNPGKYEMPVLRWTWMPLSSFTDHAVGKPLIARRLYWLHVCPVLIDEKAEDITHEEILVAPRSPAGTWASAASDKLLEKIHEVGSHGFAPDTGQDDLLPPFPVAVYARKKVNEKMAQAVVLGMGFSFIDPYLNQSVPTLVGRGLGKPEPPPTGNTDLITNSVYHLIEQDRFIGAGPTVIQPIRIGPGALLAVQIAVGVGWPVLILAVGLVVLVMRRG